MSLSYPKVHSNGHLASELVLNDLDGIEKDAMHRKDALLSSIVVRW